MWSYIPEIPQRFEWRLSVKWQNKAETPRGQQIQWFASRLHDRCFWHAQRSWHRNKNLCSGSKRQQTRWPISKPQSDDDFSLCRHPEVVFMWRKTEMRSKWVKSLIHRSNTGSALCHSAARFIGQTAADESWVEQSTTDASSQQVSLGMLWLLIPVYLSWCKAHKYVPKEERAEASTFSGRG